MQRRASGVHPESPLSIPLVARALRCPRIRLVPRAIDSTWFYRRYVTRANTGFNPFSGCVYHASHGALSPWLVNPEQSARPYNAQDEMMRELLFVVHDYLHAWSYALLSDLAPELGLGTAPITEGNLETLTFAHLLTEAVATVGLDYWCLAIERLGDRCPMGTALEGATTSYREWHRTEYARVWPDLVVVQDPSFLHWLLSCYTSGGARMSISERTMDRSALLARWIRGELTYAKRQRRYIRRWLAHLGGLPPRVQAAEDAPVSYDAGWQRDLVIHVALRTWALVKEDQAHPLKALRDERTAWHTTSSSAVDFHLTNVNALSKAGLARAAQKSDPSQRKALCEQYVMRFSFSDVPLPKRREIRAVLRRHDFFALLALLEGEKRIPAGASEPRDLMFFA